MSTHKWIDRICAAATALALVLTVLFMNGEALGIRVVAATLGYENRLFDNTRVHKLDIVIDDWDSFIATAQSEVYEMCSVVIDGEKYSNVAIRAKGNTSLMNVSAMGSQRYSFKIEFDHYDSTKSYHGLDKLSLNNLIQDNTMMKDYLAYTLMAEFGAATPLCSFVYVTVNGEDFGLYLAVEAVEDSFIVRNYGSTDGDLYKPDTLNMGGDGGSGGGEPAGDNAEPNQGGDASSGGGESTDPNVADPTQPTGDGGSPGGESAGGETTDPNATDPTQPAGSEGSEGGELTGEAPAGDGGSAGSEGGEAATIPADADESQHSATEPTGEAPTGDDGSQGSEGGDPAATEPTREAPTGDDGSQGSEGGEPSATEPTGEAPAGDGGSGGSGGGENTEGDNQGPGGGGMFGMGSSGASLQYVGDDLSGYSSIFASAKTDLTEEDQIRLVEALKILDTGVPDSVDVDGVIRYFVVHNYVVNGDSYTGGIIHNYYLYEENGILSMIPWDYNLGYGTFQGNDADASVNDDIDMPLSTNGNDRPMIDWILNSEEYTALYHSYFQEFLDTVDPVAIIEAAYELIAPYVEKDPTKFCSYEEFETGVAALKAFCKLRTQSVRLQLSGSDAKVDTGDLKISDLGIMGGDTPGGDNGSSGGGEENENTGPSGGGEQPADPNGTETENPSGGDPAATEPTGEAPAGDGGSQGSEGGEPSGTEPTGETPAGWENPSSGGEPSENADTSDTREPPAGMEWPQGSQTGTVSDDQWQLLAVTAAVLAVGLLIALLYKR